MLKKLVVALTFGPVGPVIYALIRWGDNKEILATPVFLVTLATFGFGLVFAYFFGPWESTISFVRKSLLIVAFLLTGIVVGIIDNAWPAEPSNVHRDALLGESVSPLPEVEAWQVVHEIESFGGLITIKYHQDPNDPNKLGVSLWFPNKARNYEYEAFARMTNFVVLDRNEDNFPAKVDGSKALVSLKLENNTWTEPVPGIKSFVSVDLFNGEPAIIYSVTDDNGDTKTLRAFLLNDLVKPQN